MLEKERKGYKGFHVIMISRLHGLQTRRITVRIPVQKAARDAPSLLN